MPASGIFAADVARWDGDITRGHTGVPVHLWPGIRAHILEGVPTGDFLSALFANDLRDAVCRADPDSLAAIVTLAKFLYQSAPAASWGSWERVHSWRQFGGIAGGAHRRMVTL